MLEKIIVCYACGLRSPSFESSSMLYITPTYTSSTQELIKQTMQQKWEKSCFWWKKNTWHVESNHILQPPKYLIILVNRFRYINNNFTKDRCSIPMDMTVILGLHKFSLQATVDRHGPSMYSGHFTASINCCKKTFNCNDSRKRSFRCFCPWTFFENIGFNTVPTDPFMSHLATQLGYSAGEFQALQLIVLAAFDVVD